MIGQNAVKTARSYSQFQREVNVSSPMKTLKEEQKELKDVSSSVPFWKRMKRRMKTEIQGLVAQFGRAPDLHSGGCRFEACRVHQFFLGVV